MANKIKWVKFQDKIHEEIPEVKAMTIDPHLSNKDSPRSVVEMYEDKDVIKLQDFNCRDKDDITPKDWNCSHNKTKHLTILRLHPSIIRDPEKPKRWIIKSQELDRCCANFNVEAVIKRPKKKEKKKDKTPKLEITKPNVLSC